MSGQNIIIAVIVAVALGAGVWWVLSDPVGDAARSAVDQASQTTPSSREEIDDDELPTGVGRLLELYERGVPMECTFTYEHEMGSGEGSSFFDGERMRVSGLHREGGTELVSNFINDGATMYVWGEAPEGEFAVQFAATEESMMDMEEELDEAAALNEEVSYECKEWSVDASVFNPPADREFMDMGQMMQGIMPDMPDMEAMQGMEPEEIEAMMEEMMQGMPQ